MLVLTRKPQEQIRIGDSIVITILKTKGNAVKIGIEAPAEVAVLRGELAEACRRTESAQQAESAAASLFAEDEEPEGNAQMSYTRTNRSRIATVLPETLGAAAPLRALLQRRSATVSC